MERSCPESHRALSWTAAVVAALLQACGTSNVSQSSVPDAGSGANADGGSTGSADAGAGGTVASITLTAPAAYVEVGASLRFTAEARNASGALLSGVTFTWRSSNPAVATVANGDARGVAPGAALISAESGGISSADALLAVKGPAPSGGPSSDELIDAALAAGTIDNETALAYKVFAVFGDPQLPVRYLGDDSGVFESNILQTLNQQFDSLSDNAQTALGRYLLRPSSIGSWADPSAAAPPASGSRTPYLVGRPGCPGTSSAWTTANAPSAKVNVWYDSRVLNHKLLAEKISNAIEQAIWPKLIDTLKFKEPEDDSSLLGCYGGDSRLDVYLVTSIGKLRGLTVPEGLGAVAGAHAPTYIMISGSEPPDDLPGLTAHEIMHAIQWAYTTRARQDDPQAYHWLHEATANWAIDAVFGKSKPDQVEQQYADCFLTTPALPLENADKGHCAKWSGAERFYGAYLLFQYMAKTFGDNTVKDAIEERQLESTGVEAVNAALGGRLKDVWPNFAKRLWNKEPLKDKLFTTWDDLKDGAKGHEIVGDLNGQPEAIETLEKEQPDLSSRYYHFTFSDPNTRSMLFYNGFFDEQKAGKAIKVLAVWKDANGNPQDEDWTKYEFVGLCRDMTKQRAVDLTIIVTNAEWSPAGGGKVVAANAPYLKRNNIGCWRYQGTTTALYKYPTWTGLGLQTTSNIVFQVHAGADDLAFQSPQFPDTLRLGWHVLAASGTDYTFTVSYTPSLCSISAGPVTFPLQLPTAFGVLLTNAFPELKSTDPALQEWLANKARSYTANVGSTQTVTTTVTGSGCSPTGTETVGVILSTNDVGQGGAAVNPPAVKPNGEMNDNYNHGNFSYTWNLQPQTQP